jgi:putative transcriptional regulator
MGLALLCMLLSTFSPAQPVTRSQPPAAGSFRAAAVHRGREAPAQPAKGRLLVASRSLGDPNFAETVILLISYDARGGAMGVVINRATKVRLATVLPDIEELRDRPDRVFLGGPVGGNLMLLLLRSPQHPKPSHRVFGDVYASGSVAVLRGAIGEKGKSGRLRAYAGYAGWGGGQLEREIGRGDWYLTAADAATIFDTPAEEIWPKLIERFSGEWTRVPPWIPDA